MEREIFIRIYEAEEFVPIYVDLKALISGTYKRSGKVAIKRQTIKNVTDETLSESNLYKWESLWIKYDTISTYTQMNGFVLGERLYELCYFYPGEMGQAKTSYGKDYSMRYFHKCWKPLKGRPRG